jgi:hypothetical protein
MGYSMCSSNFCWPRHYLEVTGQLHDSAATIRCIGGWVDPRIGLDDMKKWKFLILPGLELRPVGHPACILFYLNIWGGGGVEYILGPLGTAATPAPGYCEDGEVSGMKGFGKGNRSTQRKPAPTPLCPPQIPLVRLGREPGSPRWKASD